MRTSHLCPKPKFSLANIRQYESFSSPVHEKYYLIHSRLNLEETGSRFDKIDR